MKSSSRQLEFLSKSEFWHLIQTGLTHTNSLTRKRALYLLKRTTDFALVNKIKINSAYHDQYLNGSETVNVNLFNAESSLWNDFFLCIELLEETSVI